MYEYDSSSKVVTVLFEQSPRINKQIKQKIEKLKSAHISYTMLSAQTKHLDNDFFLFVSSFCTPSK